MASIPIFIVEEHHEAFVIWEQARRTGVLATPGCVLLHVDEHADIGVPRLTTSIRNLGSDLKNLEEFVYCQLAISEVVVPALYVGLFDRLCWLAQKQMRKVRQEIWVHSHSGEGKVFRLDAICPENAIDARKITYEVQSVADSFATEEQIVLDIDLDYFSCDQAENRTERVEITEHEYHAFWKDKYHFLRLNQGNRIQARCEGERFYLYLRNYEENVPCPLKVTKEQIVERLDIFALFLERNHINPVLIDIARSRISGFTPGDQWEFIEEQLLARLHKLYNLEHLAVSEMGALV